MKTLISTFSALLVLAGALPAGAQYYFVTPASLAGWQVTGADRQKLQTQSTITIPAGAQLARAFPADGVSVRLTTRPVFGPDRADWPVLEIGDAALVFQRNGNEGKLTLALGEATPLTLPFAIKLDDNGQSTEPLTLDFTRDAATVQLGLSGQTLRFPVRPSSHDAPLEVVASAGASQAWPLASLAVTVSTPDAASTKAGNAGVGDATGGTNLAPARSSSTAGGAESAVGAKIENTTSGSADKAAVADGHSAGSPTLEVFTPPSVRHGRADAIRSAVAKNQQP